MAKADGRFFVKVKGLNELKSKADDLRNTLEKLEEIIDGISKVELDVFVEEDE